MGRSAANQFRDEIERLIEYFSKEYHLSYAEAIGVLTIIQAMLVDEVYEREDVEG